MGFCIISVISALAGGRDSHCHLQQLMDLFPETSAQLNVGFLMLSRKRISEQPGMKEL